MARRSTGRRFGGVRRRTTNWINATTDMTAPAGISSGVQTVVTQVALAEGGTDIVTIMRIRGMIHLELALETVAPVIQEVGVGIALVDDRALAVSPAAGVGLPQPIDDEDFEGWMWWYVTYLGYSDTAGGVVGGTTDYRVAAENVVVDSKAM